ncbi:MAG: serpin family protein [Sedimentisphaerales bacterium]|jgi:serpin B
MKTKQLYIILFLLILTAGKALAADTNNRNDVNATVTGNTTFAFDLYAKLAKDSKTSNLFFSPYSISTALAMTYGGARGETQSQMANVLNFTLPNQKLYSAFGDLQKHLIQENKSGGYQLLLANALWGQKGEPFLKEFLDSTQNYYGAGLRQLDFINETERSRQIINSWVEENTKDKIKDLIPQGDIDRDTILVLTNAIYFKGDWKTKFKKKDTQSTDFYLSAKDKVKADMMQVKEKFKCYADEKMQVLELPYKNNELSMLVFLPNKIEGLAEIENTLSTERLNDSLSKMRTTEIEIYLPKFKMTWGTFSLKKTLIDLGMSNAFKAGKADFSGINGRKNLWVSDVFHKAFIEVNEEGTEAAAGTAVVIVKSIEIPMVFRADHPFIFIIKDNRSGSILFMGRMMNPSE